MGKKLEEEKKVGWMKKRNISYCVAQKDSNIAELTFIN